MQPDIRNDYFEWLIDIACGNMYAEQISFSKLLTHLHQIEFKYLIPRDYNRAEDGISLRRRYAYTVNHGYSYDYIISELQGPCSVLEMMLALAIRCEEDYMDDPSIGSRTIQWFWGMVRNLGLGSMMDHLYDENYVDMVIDRFLRRDYEPNGRGGLFTIENCGFDLRTIEIWYQMNWYLNTFE